MVMPIKYYEDRKKEITKLNKKIRTLEKENKNLKDEHIALKRNSEVCRVCESNPTRENSGLCEQCSKNIKRLEAY